MLQQLSLPVLLSLTEDKRNWFYLGRWVQPTLSMCFWPLWAKRKTYDRLGLPPVSGYNIQVDGHYFDLNPCFDTIIEASYNACLNEDEEIFKKFAATADQTSAFHLNHSKNLKKDGSLEQLEPFFDSMNELVVPWTAVFPIGLGLDKCLNEELAKHGLKKIDLLDYAALPKPTMMIQQEHQARVFAESLKNAGLMHLLDERPEKILQLISEKNLSLSEQLRNHLEEFEWVGTHHCLGEPLTYARLFNQIRETPPSRTTAFGLPQLPSKLAWLVKWQNEFAYYRQYCAEASDVGFYKARWLLSNAADSLSLSYEEIIWLSDKEILSSLQTGQVPPREEIAKRTSGFSYFETEEDELIYSGERVQKLVELLVPKTDLSIKKFSGTVGSRGMASGRAFVAFTPQEATTMQKGEILVVPQTTPDYIMVMKKAGAIVTDEGGMTCHAAVVSRELGIPCVVGTKIGTSVIKTGVLIDVNAQTGEITIR